MPSPVVGNFSTEQKKNGNKLKQAQVENMSARHAIHIQREMFGVFYFTFVWNTIFPLIRKHA